MKGLIGPSAFLEEKAPDTLEASDLPATKVGYFPVFYPFSGIHGRGSTEGGSVWVSPIPMYSGIQKRKTAYVSKLLLEQTPCCCLGWVRPTLNPLSYNVLLLSVAQFLINIAKFEAGSLHLGLSFYIMAQCPAHFLDRLTSYSSYQ